MHGLHQEAELLGQLLAHALDAAHQLAALIAVDERNQPVADLESDEIDLLDVVPAKLAFSVGGRRGRLRRAPPPVAASPRLRASLREPVGARAAEPPPSTGTRDSACRA